MAYLHDSDPSGTAAWFEHRLAEQGVAHDGRTLRGWADQVVAQLPAGPVDLVSTSPEGCALAAVVAAIRNVPGTTWRQVHLGRAREVRHEGRTVVVEALTLGPGLKAAIEQAFPGAPVLDGFANGRALLAA